MNASNPILSTALVLALSACAHTAEKNATMLGYEQLRDAEYGDIVRERDPRATETAQSHYAEALESEADGEPDAARHNAFMAMIEWRIAQSQSELTDATEAKLTAEKRRSAADAAFEEAAKRLARAKAAKERHRKIAELERRVSETTAGAEAQARAGSARAQVDAALVAIREAEGVDAATHASAQLEAASAALTEASEQLARGNLDAAKRSAERALKSARVAKRAATPQYNAEREARQSQARRHALFEAAAKLRESSRRISERGIVVTFRDFFDVGETAVRPDRQASAAALAKLAAEYEEFSLIVEAHTDNRGKDSTNLALSQARADSILTVLTGAGVSPRRLTAVGKGSGEPIANNRSRAGRAQNRRIDVVFVQEPSTSK